MYRSDLASGLVADQLAGQIATHVQQALPLATSPGQSPSVVEYEPLAVTESWTEVWPDADGKEATRSVQGRIWNASIQAALAKYGAAFLPHCDAPYYLNEPIVLKPGQRLSADPRAEIRLVPGVNTCMVRNEHLVASQEGPVPADAQPDTQISWKAASGPRWLRRTRSRTGMCWAVPPGKARCRVVTASCCSTMCADCWSGTSRSGSRGPTACS